MELDVLVLAGNSSAQEALDQQSDTLWPGLKSIFPASQTKRLLMHWSGPVPVLKVGGRPATIGALRRFFGLAPAQHIAGHFPAQKGIGLLLNGICLLQAIRRAGFTAQLVNNLATETDRVERLLSQRPRVVVLSTTFFYHRLMVEATASRLRSMGCDAPIIAGGPFITRCMRYREWLLCLSEQEREWRKGLDEEQVAYYFVPKSPQDTGVDWFVLDMYGFQTLFSLIRAYKEKLDTDGIRGVARSGPKGWELRPGEDTAWQIEHDVVSWDQMVPELRRYGSDGISLRVTAGCPRHCKFCDFSTFSGRYHQRRELTGLERELASLAATGVRPSLIYLVNDNLILPDSVSMEMALVFQRTLRGRILFEVQSDLAFARKPSTVEAWRDAGLFRIWCGVESGSDLVRRNMDKAHTADWLRQAVQRFVGVGGISLHSHLIIGFPGESEETVSETIEFLEDYPTAKDGAQLTFNVSALIVLPLTPLDALQSRRRFDLRGIGIHWNHGTMSHSEAQRLAMRIYLNVKRVMYTYNRAEEPELTLGLHQARQALCKLDFETPDGAAIDANPGSTKLWYKLANELAAL